MAGIKCVTVGDGTVGKTCMLISYKSNKFPTEYVPTVFDQYEAELTVDNKTHTLFLWDIAGQEEFDSLRPLTYSKTEVFLVCFAVDSLMSFENVQLKWIPEIQLHSPGTPFLLIGTKSDLRKGTSKVVSTEKAELLAEGIGAVKYLECSALRRVGLNEVFEGAVRAVIYKTETTCLTCELL